MKEPASAASPGTQPDTVVDTPHEVGERVLVELVDAWISARNRVPKFLQLHQTPGPPAMGGEKDPATRLFRVLGSNIWDTELLVAPPNPLVWFNRRVLHPWWMRRGMVREATALGLEARFARRLADRFDEIWDSGETHALSRKDQTARIVELLRAIDTG